MINVKCVIYFLIYLFDISKSKFSSYIDQEQDLFEIKHIERIDSNNSFQNQKNLAFIRLFFNQNNSLNLNKKTFPIYLYLPLPSSQNININIKFMNFVYDQQSDFSENNFKVTGYLVNEIVISDINNHANFSSAKRIDAKYYISETTAFFNFDSSKDNILYIMINKSEKNFNNYESFRIDVFCNEQNVYPNFSSVINRFIFGNIKSHLQTENNINKIVYSLNTNHFKVELIEKDNNNLLEWSIEHSVNNSLYQHNTTYIKQVTSHRGIKSFYFNNSDFDSKNSSQYFVILSIKSSTKQSVDYMIKFSEYEDSNIHYSPKIYKRFQNNRISFTFDNLFHNNENINYITYTIKGFNQNKKNKKQFDSPFNKYVGEQEENMPDYFLTKSEIINPVNDKVTYSIEISPDNKEHKFYFYLNAHIRTDNGHESIILYEPLSVSLIDSTVYKELLLNFLNVFEFEKDDPFSQPYIQELEVGTNQNIYFHMKLHDFVYKTTTPPAQYLQNNELSLVTTIYEVNQDYISEYKADPSINLPNEGIIAHEYKFDHIIMQDLTNISEKYLFITIKANNETEINLFQNFILDIIIVVNDDKPPTWFLPHGFYYINTLNSSHKKMFALNRKENKSIFYIEISSTNYTNFFYSIEPYSNSPTFQNNTPSSTQIIKETGKTIIIFDASTQDYLISFWETPYREVLSTQVTINYCTFPNISSIPSFKFNETIQIDYDFTQIGSSLRWSFTTQNLLVLFVGVDEMYFLYKFYSQNQVTETNDINQIILPPDNEDPYHPHLIVKKKIEMDDLYVKEILQLPSEFNYLSLLCSFKHKDIEYKVAFLVSGINATVIRLESLTLLDSKIIYYSDFLKYNSKDIYLYMEIEKSRPEIDLIFNWNNVTYENKNVFIQDFFDVNVYYTNFTFIYNRVLNDTIKPEDYIVSYGKHFPFENANIIHLNTNQVSSDYEYLYIEITSSENNTNQYLDFNLDVSIMKNKEHHSIKVLYPNDYNIFQKLPNSKYCAFELYRTDIAFKVCYLEFGVKNNEPQLDFSIEIGDVPRYQNESMLIIHEYNNNILIDLSNISDSKVYLYVFNTSILSNPIEFYIKSEFNYYEGNLTRINYSNIFQYRKINSTVSFENLPASNTNLNITEITYELYAYYVKEISHLEYLNSLFIPSIDDNPYYLSFKNVTHKTNDNITKEIIIPFEVERNDLYYFILKAFGYYGGGLRFKLKYEIKVINTTFIDFPVIDINNITTKRFDNTSTILNFTPFYFYVEQNTPVHNLEILFKYNCKYKVKTSDDVFNITGYIVDFDFIENRKENDTEPIVSSLPEKAISLKTENSYLLKAGTKYTYVIISFDPLNTNVYNLIDFQIIINDKKSNELPKFVLPNNEYFYGKIENNMEQLKYKLNFSSQNHNFLKIEVIQNTNNENFKWKIFQNLNNDNLMKIRFNDNNFIKSNITKNGKTSIILDFRNQIKLNEIFISFYSTTNQIPFEYIFRYFSDEYEENFIHYSYNMSNIQLSFDKNKNELNFLIPYIKTKSNQIITNIEYYLRGFNFTAISNVNNIDTLLTDENMLIETPLYTDKIIPSFIEQSDCFNYSLNLTNKTTAYYFTVVGIIYDESGNKIDMLGYDIVTFKLNSETTENIIIILFSFGAAIMSLIIIILCILCCCIDKKRNRKIFNDEKLNNSENGLPLENELLDNSQDSNLE